MTAHLPHLRRTAALGSLLAALVTQLSAPLATPIAAADTPAKADPPPVSTAPSAKKTLLLLSHKPDGHPPGTHEYAPAQEQLKKLLADVPGLTVTHVNADEPWPEGPALLDKADGVVIFVSQGAAWLQADPRRHEAFTRLADRRGGITALHWGLGTKDAANIEGFVRLLGACHGGPDRKFAVLDTPVRLPHPDHPIVAGLKPFDLHEEFYFNLKRASPKYGVLTPLLTIPVDNQEEMVGWAFERADHGRSFGFTGLHFHKNWDRPEYQQLLTRGILWTIFSAGGQATPLR